MKKSLFVFLLICFLDSVGRILPVFAQDVNAEWAQFQAKYGNHLQFTLNERTGMPQDILGFIEPKEILAELGLVAIQNSQDADLLWEAFLDTNEPLFGVNSSDFPPGEVREMMTRRWGQLYKVRRQQVHEGVLIEGTKAIMFVDSQGRILSFSVQAEPNIQIPVIPTINQEKALSIVQAEALQKDREVHAELMVLVNEDNDTIPHALVWRISVRSKDSRATEIIRCTPSFRRLTTPITNRRYTLLSLIH